MWAIEHSRVGMTFRGIKQADSLAESVGINTTSYKVLAFAIGRLLRRPHGRLLRPVHVGRRPHRLQLPLHHLHIDLHDRGWRGQLHRAYHRGGASSPCCPRWRGRSSRGCPSCSRPSSWRSSSSCLKGWWDCRRGWARLSSGKTSKGDSPMLQVEGLTKNFGGLAAVNAVDMSIQPGELVGLIGPNGAGKTTFFNLVTGYIRPSCGQGDLRRQGRHRQEAALCRGKRHDPQLSAGQRLRGLHGSARTCVLAAHLNSGINFWQTVLKTRSSRRNERARSGRRLRRYSSWSGIRHLADTTGRIAGPWSQAHAGHRRRACL